LFVLQTWEEEKKEKKKKPLKRGAVKATIDQCQLSKPSSMEHGAAKRNKNPTSTSDCMRIRKCLCTEPDKQESATINQPDP
jgi:hypothetical protein